MQSKRGENSPVRVRVLFQFFGKLNCFLKTYFKWLQDNRIIKSWYLKRIGSLAKEFCVERLNFNYWRTGDILLFQGMFVTIGTLFVTKAWLISGYAHSGEVRKTMVKSIQAAHLRFLETPGWTDFHLAWVVSNNFIFYK